MMVRPSPRAMGKAIGTVSSGSRRQGREIKERWGRRQATAAQTFPVALIAGEGSVEYV